MESEQNGRVSGILSESEQLTGSLRTKGALSGKLTETQGIRGEVNRAQYTTKDYNNLNNLPSIEEIILRGDHTLNDFDHRFFVLQYY